MAVEVDNLLQCDLGAWVQVSMRWSTRQNCSIVQRRMGMAAPRYLQIAEGGIVACCHREIVVEPVDAAFVACSLDTAVASGNPECSQTGTVGDVPACVCLYTAALLGIRSR